ncbi:TlpA family protein disulfide reductase [Oceanivirga miroungae]|uniref:Alkyl hydroperoxide reductase/ thiol specific antioxidant/ Mal allergen n=1 Tax=Oceanivirga miroungae TaxID=1130046 RepID=A0A6I8MEE8_9FUSO|nr:TlpA disulfide reductase family protein [Oceanivirga miroungae]VWL85462.1 alkyl hydroperoxide reductase/ thiol specific antioxidant/ Mal allergen [Oceanivirga miroungae]
MKKIIITMFFVVVSIISFSEANFVNVSSDTFDEEKYIVYTALWCPHCRAEYEHIQSIYEKYKDNFNLVVYVSSDDTKEKISNYFDAKHFTFPIIYDEDNFYAKRVYNIKYLPTIIKYKKGYDLKVLDLVFNVNNYYEYNKHLIDKNVRKSLKDVVLLNKENKEVKLVDIATDNKVIVYENTNEFNDDYVYLVNDKIMNIDEFLNLNKDNVFYILSKNLDFDKSYMVIVKDSLFTNSFMPIR